MVITSRDNPNVKRIAKLTKRSEARKEGVIYLEGTRLCEEALTSGQTAREVIVTEDKISWAKEFTPDIEPLVLSKDVFTKISQTVNPQGVAIIIDEPQISAEIPRRGDNKDIYVVLENTQDPGNLGTIIRMADAFGLTAVIVSPTTCDPYNDKVIRATMGSVWHIPIVRKTMDECFSFFEREIAMTDEIRSFIENDRKELLGEFCRGCGYCMPCTVDITINQCARMSQMIRRAPSQNWLTDFWQNEMMKIENCVDCGICKTRCPYELDIPNLLKKNLQDYKEILAGKEV